MPIDDELVDPSFLRKGVDELTFGSAIRSHRICEEWTLKDTALKAGISPSLLSDYEHGRKLPSVQIAYKIAEIIGIHPGMAVILLINDQLRRAELPIKVALAS